MNWNRLAACLLIFACALPAAVAPRVAAQTPPPPARFDTARQESSVPRSAERWVRQLENELEHLQEDLLYERGQYPQGLSDEVEQTLQTVTHFHLVLRRNRDAQHLMRDFNDMDQQVHQLVNRLNQSGDSWLRRQAQRISYPDEQLHYVLQTSSGSGSRELLARHAHTLENEASNLRQLVERIGGPTSRLREATRNFADEAEHFHSVVERGADVEHLGDDFTSVDDQWNRVVDQINRSGYGIYLRRAAQNVDRVHNQIQQLVNQEQRDHAHEPGHQRADGRGQVQTQQPVESRQRVQPRQRRRGIEVEIPGVGRFRIPR